MIEEFAIEPQSLDSYQTFKYVTDKFDIAKGLIISDFPRRWKRAVWKAYETSPNFQDVEGLRLLEVLDSESFKTKVFRTGRTYREDIGNWLRAAQASHDDEKQGPFGGIVVKEAPQDGNGGYPVYTVEQIWDNSSPLERDGGRRVPQNAEDFAGALAKLLQLSKEVILVDPHFNPSTKRWREALEHLVHAFHRPNVAQPERFELHLKAGNRYLRQDEYNIDGHRDACLEKLPRCIPAGWRLKVFRWKEVEGGEEMHDRFVLTENMGITSGRGLAKRDESTGKATFNITNLGRGEAWSYWRKAMQEGAMEFELIGEIIEVVGTRNMSQRHG